jgi:hypothetical protein
MLRYAGNLGCVKDVSVPVKVQINFGFQEGLEHSYRCIKSVVKEVLAAKSKKQIGLSVQLLGHHLGKYFMRKSNQPSIFKNWRQSAGIALSLQLSLAGVAFAADAQDSNALTNSLMNPGVPLPALKMDNFVGDGFELPGDPNFNAKKNQVANSEAAAKPAEAPVAQAAQVETPQAQVENTAKVETPQAQVEKTAQVETPQAQVESTTASVQTPSPSNELAASKTEIPITAGEALATETPAITMPVQAGDLTKTAFATTGGVSYFEGPGPIVIDNDELAEVEETIKYEELPTDDGKTRVKTGARFPVVVCTQLTSKTAKKGDPFQARLKYDLKIGDRLVAKRGAMVNGHLSYVLAARSTLHTLVSPERWYRNSGVLKVSFDEIINEKGEHLPLVALPARMARIVKNKAEGRELGVNHHGEVTGPWAQQLRYKAVRVGLNFALAPAGVFTFGAMPVALGVIGAANPSFAFMKPVGLNVRHRRLKGFAWGFLSGIPGSFLIEDTVVRGQEAVIQPGDEFLVELQQEFTGEPASDAELLPNASTKVRGQVMNAGKKKKK